MGDDYGLIDTPGSPGFSASGAAALGAADLAIVVVDPDPVRAPLAEPALRQLESLGVPHVIFVNRIDQARGSIRELLSALQPMSAAALVARQIPISEGERITGFIDQIGSESCGERGCQCVSISVVAESCKKKKN